jgi:hypothetical protein
MAMRRFIGVLAAAGVLVGVATSASADEPGASRVIELERTTIVGERQQPEAMYILHRSPTGYEVRDLRASFVREVIRSTGEAPF